jgi:hypothetical protein
MKKKILLYTMIAAVSLGITKSSMASNQMDGTIYPVLLEGTWYVEYIKDPNYNSYTPKPFLCYLKTDYQGEGGVEVRMKFTNGNGEHHKQIVKYNETATMNSSGFSFYGDSFKQPAMTLFNEGCSKYLDGDKCNNDKGYRPVVYASCVYT